MYTHAYTHTQTISKKTKVNDDYIILGHNRKDTQEICLSFIPIACD